MFGFRSNKRQQRSKSARPTTITNTNTTTPTATASRANKNTNHQSHHGLFYHLFHLKRKPATAPSSPRSSNRATTTTRRASTSSNRKPPTPPPPQPVEPVIASILYYDGDESSASSNISVDMSLYTTETKSTVDYRRLGREPSSSNVSTSDVHSSFSDIFHDNAVKQAQRQAWKANAEILAHQQRQKQLQQKQQQQQQQQQQELQKQQQQQQPTKTTKPPTSPILLTPTTVLCSSSSSDGSGGLERRQESNTGSPNKAHASPITKKLHRPQGTDAKPNPRYTLLEEEAVAVLPTQQPRPIPQRRVFPATTPSAFTKPSFSSPKSIGPCTVLSGTTTSSLSYCGPVDLDEELDASSMFQSEQKTPVTKPQPAQCRPREPRHPVDLDETIADSTLSGDYSDNASSWVMSSTGVISTVTGGAIDYWLPTPVPIQDEEQTPQRKTTGSTVASATSSFHSRPRKITESTLDSVVMEEDPDYIWTDDQAGTSSSSGSSKPDEGKKDGDCSPNAHPPAATLQQDQVVSASAPPTCHVSPPPPPLRNSFLPIPVKEESMQSLPIKEEFMDDVSTTLQNQLQDISCIQPSHDLPTTKPYLPRLRRGEEPILVQDKTEDYPDPPLIMEDTIADESQSMSLRQSHNTLLRTQSSGTVLLGLGLLDDSNLPTESQSMEQDEHVGDKVDDQDVDEASSSDGDGDDEHSMFRDSGAVLLTQRELEKHMKKTEQTSGVVPMTPYEAWKLEQEQRKRYFSKLQEKVQNQRSKEKESLLMQQERQRAPSGLSSHSAWDHNEDNSLPTIEDQSPIVARRRNDSASTDSSTPQRSRKWALLGGLGSGGATPTDAASQHQSFSSRSSKMSWCGSVSSSKKNKRRQRGENTKVSLSLDDFMTISSAEPTDVANFSVAQMQLDQLTLADATLQTGETVDATCTSMKYSTTRTQQLYRLHLDEERRKQHEATLAPFVFLAA